MFSLAVRRVPAALALLVLVAGAAALPRGGHGVEVQTLRDTVLVFRTGDEVEVTVRPMTATGTEICAALGRGVRGNKVLFAENDARTRGVGLPTTLRFPGSGITPVCTRHRHTAGDTVHVQLARQWLDHVAGRAGRVTVGYHALPVEALQRRRVTFRWLRDGAGSGPPRDTTVAGEGG